MRKLQVTFIGGPLDGRHQFVDGPPDEYIRAFEAPTELAEELDLDAEPPEEPVACQMVTYRINRNRTLRCPNGDTHWFYTVIDQ